MTKMHWWRPLAISTISVCMAVLLSWSLFGFLQFERASVELPRLFLKLERAIGYDGFIHNFKNFVIRPNQDGYFDAALEDYRVAEQTIKEIAALAEALDIKTNLEPI